MRHFIRHPSDVPIEYRSATEEDYRSDTLRDVSLGGLCFQTESPVAPGTDLVIRIGLLDPPFEIPARVVWFRRNGDHYDVGVKFDDENTEFRVRMVEQLCYIEQFRREASLREGRTVSGEEAAIEWVKRYAATFPR